MPTCHILFFSELKPDTRFFPKYCASPKYWDRLVWANSATRHHHDMTEKLLSDVKPEQTKTTEQTVQTQTRPLGEHLWGKIQINLTSDLRGDFSFFHFFQGVSFFSFSFFLSLFLTARECLYPFFFISCFLLILSWACITELLVWKLTVMTDVGPTVCG